jgi:hypothetical protein
MNRKLSLLLSAFFGLGLMSLACASGETVVNSGTGNSSGSAGTTGGGNSSGTAGTTGSGNTTGRGGTTGSGNVTGTAGTTGTGARGGTTGSGNVTGTAGTTGTGARGGTTGTGNVTGTAGTTGGGNVTGTAGTSATGTAGTSGTTQCGATFAVQNDGFVTAPSAKGPCWSGYASAGGDTASTVMPKDFSMCGANCVLKATGTVGPSVSPTYAGYAYLGFNVGQPSGGATAGTIVPTGTGIKVAFANSSATTTLRVQLVGDSTGSTIWCYTVTGASPVMIPYGMFTKACYNTPPGATYMMEPITSVQLNIPGDATAKALNLTLTSITEY